MSEPIMPGAEGNHAEFSAIINSDAELAVLGTPTPPWEHANDDPSAMIECTTRLAEASEQDALFVPTLDQLYHDLKTSQLNLGISAFEYNHAACIRDAAWLVRHAPSPDTVSAWFEAREASSFRFEDDMHMRYFIASMLETSVVAPSKTGATILAEARNYLDPQRRKAAQEHVMAVVYGDRYTAYKQAKSDQKELN